MLSKLFSIIRTLIAWTYLGAMSVVFTPILLVLLPTRRPRLLAFGVFCRLTGLVMAILAGARLPRGFSKRMRAVHPAIYVFNHTSYLDNFIASGAAPIATVAMAQDRTIWVPFFGHLYYLSGQVLVNRKERRASANALRKLIETTQAMGMSAMLWPEGGRSIDGRLRPFKRGFVHLALATRLPIVPIVVSNAHRCWTKGSFFTRFANVGVQVLPPICTRDWALKTLDQHVADVRAQFIAALPADQQPLEPELRV